MADGGVFSSTKSFLFWALSVYVAIFRRVPFVTLLLVITILFSQLSMVVAFFLPLKVIILLGSSELPQYFSAMPVPMGRDEFIIFISFLAIMAYLAFVVANRMVSFFSQRGSAKILTNTEKLSIFNNQEDVAARAYQRFAGFMSGVVFLVVSLVLLFYIYFSLSAFLFFGLPLCFIAVAAFFRWSDRFSSYFSSHPGEAVSLVFGVFFLFLFVFIVYDLIDGSNANVYGGIGALLLCRQLLQRLSLSVTDAVVVSRQKVQVNSLFFNYTQYHEASPSDDNDVFFSLIGCEAASREIFLLFEQNAHLLPVSMRHKEIESVHYIQSSLVDVLLLNVVLRDGAGCGLVKLYRPRHERLARNEIDLLLSLGDEGLPAPTFLFAGNISGLRVHVYAFNSGSEGEGFDYSVKRDAFRVAVWSVAPDKGMTKRYFRSHLTLPGRLLDWKRIISGDVLGVNDLDDFYQTLERASSLISDLPLVFVNPDINDVSLVISNSDPVATTCLHWERWAIEPIGADLQGAESSLPHIKKILSESKIERTPLAEVDPLLVRLCALCSRFDVQLKGQKFTFASLTFTEIQSCLAEVELHP